MNTRVIRIEKSRELEVDLCAIATDSKKYSVIGEVKNRSTKKADLSEIQKLEQQSKAIQEKEGLKKVQPFFFSRLGFTQEASDYCKKHQIATSENEGWLQQDSL